MFLSILENMCDLVKFHDKYKDNHHYFYYKTSKYIARIYNAIYIFNNIDKVSFHLDTDVYLYGGYSKILSLKTSINTDIDNQGTYDVLLNDDFNFVEHIKEDTTTKSYKVEHDITPEIFINKLIFYVGSPRGWIHYFFIINIGII